jgi:hypothetical protein
MRVRDFYQTYEIERRIEGCGLVCQQSKRSVWMLDKRNPAACNYQISIEAPSWLIIKIYMKELDARWSAREFNFVY